MQNHLHANQINISNSFSIFQILKEFSCKYLKSIKLTGTGPQNEFMNIIVCLRIQLIRGSKSRHKLIGKAHALWGKKQVTPSHRTNQTN